MKRILSFLLVATISIVFIGCEPHDKKNNGNGKINIVSVIFPEYDFAEAVAGDNANVSMLVNPGSSTHSFEPSPDDIKKIDEADVFIYTGGESDEWVEEILESMDTSDKTVIRLMNYVNSVKEETVEGMESKEGHDYEHGDAHEDVHDDEHAHEDENGHDNVTGHHGHEDEHIWTSPQNAMRLVQAISDQLCDVDAKNAEAYKNNTTKYIAELQALDNSIIDVVNNAQRKKIIVADKFPFRYLVDAYGLEYSAAFNGCSDQSDASAKTIAFLIDTVKKDNIPYVYYVELSNQNVAKAVSEQTGAGMLLLHSCHNVTKADFDAGVTYISLMKQNVENLRKGLN